MANLALVIWNQEVRWVRLQIRVDSGLCVTSSGSDWVSPRVGSVCPGSPSLPGMLAPHSGEGGQQQLSVFIPQLTPEKDVSLSLPESLLGPEKGLFRPSLSPGVPDWRVDSILTLTPKERKADMWLAAWSEAQVMRESHLQEEKLQGRYKGKAGSLRNTKVYL